MLIKISSLIILLFFIFTYYSHANIDLLREIHPVLLLTTLKDTLQQDYELLLQQAPNVFIDCAMCDLDYIKTEINYVNYMRDPNLADVNILVTTLSTAVGGLEYTLSLKGNSRFEGINDTLVFTTLPGETPDNTRKKFAQVLAKGLIRYVNKTPISEFITISYHKPQQIQKTVKIIDPWKNWVFRIYINSNFNGEKSYKSLFFTGGFSASKITEEWKIRNSIDLNYNESKYDYEVIKYLNVFKGYEFENMTVYSVSDNFSAGGFFSISSSTFSNIKLGFTTSPAIEYNFFDYKESTHRQLRLMYKLSYKNFRYREETIFNKNFEHLFQQTASLTFTMNQTWGSVSTSISGSNYFHDLKKRRLTLFTSLNIRLLEGLSLNFYTSYSRINDQIQIPKSGATEEEILLRQKQLATNYSYYGFIGISYTFGSIYSTIVNPRFGDTGGFTFIMY